MWHGRAPTPMLLLFLAFPATAQYESRNAAIEAEREKKTRDLKPDVVPRSEQFLLNFREKKILERFAAGIAGFRVKLGGLMSGSGFAAGPEYLRQELGGGRLTFRGSARGSLKKYYLMDLELDAQGLAGNRVFFNLYGVHRDYPRMNYYGPGPDSAKTGRSDFRLEDTAYDGAGGIRPWRHLKLGATGGYLQVNVGPGTDPRFVSTEKIYGPDSTPGIDRQSDFLRGGFFAQYDTRDIPGGPRKGGNYLFRHLWYADRKLELHSFRRLDFEAQQYIPLFNQRRVIALRGKSVLTYADRRERVPFYLQPTLGGSEDLRGFRPFRFYGDNMLVMNAEYRWETFSGLDMAIFADAGKVFNRHADFNFKDLESSVGFGMRFNVYNAVFLRLDVGFSHEGFQVWVKFNNVF